VYNYFNICNFPIYFYNIFLKHLQHTSETLEIYACNMRFPRDITLLFGRKELVVMELDAGKEVGGSAWSSLVRQQSGKHCARPRAPQAIRRAGASTYG
jgi:hypothetical protein